MTMLSQIQIEIFPTLPFYLTNLWFSKNSKLGKDLTARFLMYHKKGIETFGYSNKFPIKILALHKEENMPTF